MANSFTADIAKWKNLTAAKRKKVAIDSIQDVLEGAQTTARGISVGGAYQRGKIPVASGDLVNSLSSSIGPSGGAKGAASYTIALAGFEIGDIVRFEWTMEYALAIEVGFKSYPGAHFVGFNAAKFSEHVDKNARLVGGIQ